MITLKTIDFQKAVDEVSQAIKALGGNKSVTVGIHEGAGVHEGGEITMAQLGAVHEFGTEIEHPGGTTYGYRNMRDAQSGARKQFLGKANRGRSLQDVYFGYELPGVTQAHTITIPARPWLVPGVESGTAEYLKVIESGLQKDLPFDTILAKVGNKAEGLTRLYMRNLRTPPNAPSTIAKKGSDNPLIDSGAFVQSVTSAVQSTPLQEGLI